MVVWEVPATLSIPYHVGSARCFRGLGHWFRCLPISALLIRFLCSATLFFRILILLPVLAAPFCSVHLGLRMIITSHVCSSLLLLLGMQSWFICATVPVEESTRSASRASQLLELVHSNPST